ncbi:MAG: hypothetical protein F9K30_00565 [Dechloromonas sp.]|nr:MAG: hypothetical protein F9K30_00565 [Dechloromonas sp.]
MIQNYIAAKADCKPTIYLPVEIKARELKAKILIALVAARHGFRIYLGSKQAIDQLIECKPGKGGIYFYKGGKPAAILAGIKDRVDRFVVLDEEMGPAVQDLDSYYQGRIYPGTEAWVDRMFLLGQTHLDSLCRVRPELAPKAVVTGWPRVDLWRPELKHQFVGDVSALQQQHGAYLLFSSDFGVISQEALGRELRRLGESHFNEAERHRQTKRLHDAYADFDRFVALARKLDADPECPPIIIRPHPSETISVWKERLGALQKTRIIFEGEISPWLYASSGLLHRGCTTAVQAYFSDIPSIYILDAHASPKTATLPFQMSHAAANYDELVTLSRAAMEGSLHRQDDVHAQEHVFTEPALATERIVTELEHLQAAGEPPYRPSKLGAIAQLLQGRFVEWRAATGIGLSKRRVARMNRKLPGGIHAPEISRIAAGLDVVEGVSIREIAFNAIEIDMPVSKVVSVGSNT